MKFTQISRKLIPPRLSVAGYIKVGGKADRVRWSKAGPWLMPTRYVDPVRFEITTREKNIAEVVHPKDPEKRRWKLDRGYLRDERIHEEAGKAPTELQVRLIFPEPHQNLLTHLGCHDGKRWMCQGDGEKAEELQANGVLEERDCPCPRLGADPKAGLVCKPRGVLSAWLEASGEWGTVHVFKTTSWESIANLRTLLELFHEQFGTVAWLPLVLRVYPATKTYQGHGAGGGGTTTQPIVTLALKGSLKRAHQIASGAAQEWRDARLLAGATHGAAEHHAETLAREMVEEAEAEGSEYFPDTTRRAAAEDPVPRASLAARVEAQKQAVGATIPADEEDDDGPDYETLPPDGAHESDQEAEPARAGLNRTYFALLKEHAPELADSEAMRKLWQEQRVGRASCRDWSTEDFELAILLVRRGQVGVRLPEPSRGVPGTAA